MVRYLKPRVTATLPAGSEVAVVGGDLTLDSFAVPYGVASVILPYTAETSLEPLDPRTAPRITVTGRDDEAGSTRTADFHLRTRTVDHDAKTVRLDLATDEALAMDWTPLALDRAPFDYQKSLRAVCNYVLGRIPGVGGNRIPNPGFTSNVDGWTLGGGAANLRWSATAGIGGTGAAAADITDVGIAGVRGPLVNVRAGSQVTLSAEVRSSGAAMVGRPARIRAMYGSGANSLGPTTPLTSTTQRISHTVTIPAGESTVRLDIHVTDSTLLGTLIWDQVQVEEGPLTTWKGGVLASGTDDYDLTAYWEVTNLVPNPAVRSTVGNWIAGGTNGTLVRETGWRANTRPRPRPGGVIPRAIPELPGVSTVTLTTWTGNSGGGQGGAYANTTVVVPYIPVRPFTTYLVSCWARATPSGKTVELKAQLFGADGAVLESGRLIATAVMPDAWTRIEGTLRTGANSARIGPFLYRGNGLQWVAGDTLRTTAWMVYEGDRSIPFFDGATSDDAAYTYGISGTAHASASTRTPRTARDPEMFDWLPGVSAWDFLQPMLSAAGLRLFCDEKRVWRLINPATYAREGVVSLSPRNLILGVDTISLEDAEVFATGVVIRYSYRDRYDIPHLVYDTAGDSQKVVTLDYAHAYPGPGAAARILARRAGTGRTQDVEALIDWAASPAMQASVTLPDAPEQRGKVTSIRFTLDADATMSVGTSGLVDIIPGTIDALVGTIDALVGTIDSL